jgi:alkaline phosphatase D
VCWHKTKAAGEKPERTFNMLLRHGVRSCLEYAKNFDLKAARSLSNPNLAPHLEFVDLGGHGYAKVRLSADAMRTEFVCIPRPLRGAKNRTAGPSGIGYYTLPPCGRAESAHS